MEGEQIGKAEAQERAHFGMRQAGGGRLGRQAAQEEEAASGAQRVAEAPHVFAEAGQGEFLGGDIGEVGLAEGFQVGEGGERERPEQPPGPVDGAFRQVRRSRVTGRRPWRVAALSVLSVVTVAVLGTVSIVLIGRIALRLFGSVPLVAIASLLLAFEGLHFTMSRTALLDMVVMFFALAGFGALLVDRDRSREVLARRVGALPHGTWPQWGPWLGWRSWRWLAGLMLAFATSTKWSGLLFVAAFGLPNFPYYESLSNAVRVNPSTAAKSSSVSARAASLAPEPHASTPQSSRASRTSSASRGPTATSI